MPLLDCLKKDLFAPLFGRGLVGTAAGRQKEAFSIILFAGWAVKHQVWRLHRSLISSIVIPLPEWRNGRRARLKIV